MKKKVIAIIISLTIVGGLFGLTYMTKSKNKYQSVKTTTVSKGDIESYLSTTALVKSQDSRNYYGPQAKVTRVNVKVGNKVKSGDVLANFETQNLNTAVEQAQIQYNNAVLSKKDLVDQNNEINSNITSLNNKITEIDSQIQTIDKQIANLKKSNSPSSASQIDALNKQKDALIQQKSSLVQQRDSLKPISNSKLEQADNSIKNAQLSLNSAKENLAKNVNSIVADMDGVVTAVNIAEGSSGNMQQAAITVQDVDDLKATLSVSRYDAVKLSLNQSAIVKSSSTEYPGIVSFIAPLATSSNNAGSDDASMSVDVTVNDKNPELTIGFETDVDILLGEVTNVIKVPVECIKTDKDGKTYVFVVDNSKASLREVTVGVKSDTEAEVQGLQEGETVILNPTDLIEDGTLVK